jgi:hypothetical protein
VAAPLRVDRAGNTEPGFLCIHELENGNGLCASTSFEEVEDPHACVVRLRGRWNISRPCYDKPRRCPGWAGGGWKGAEHLLCHEKDGYSGYTNINFRDRWWKWKTSKCDNCGVIVLPYAVRLTSLRSWWYEIRFFKHTMWFIWLETWWGKKRRG